VEDYLMTCLGEEKLKRIQLGMPAYLKDNKGTMTDEVYSAIEVLSSLGDFEHFK